MKYKNFILITLFTFLSPYFLYAGIPGYPMAFYGNVTINNKKAPEGTIIRAYYGDVLAGTITVDSSGAYGYTESTAKKLLVGEGVGKITFTFQSSSILSNKETSGKNSISYSEYEEGLVVNKNLDFSYSASSGGGGGGGGSSSSSKTNTTSVVPLLPSQAVSSSVVEVNKNSKQSSLNFTGVVKFGSRGETTKNLQKALIEKGYLTGVADGYFGPMTLSAVKRFQEDNDLVIDGIVGPSVISALNNMLNLYSNTPSKNTATDTSKLMVITKILKFGSNSIEVREIQNKLLLKGFLSATPNGNFGPATLSAVKAFQLDNGLIPDGVVGPVTLKMLNL